MNGKGLGSGFGATGGDHDAAEIALGCGSALQRAIAAEYEPIRQSPALQRENWAGCSVKVVM